VAGSVIQFGEFVLDCDRFQLLRDGLPVKLEKIPMELLLLLALKEGRLVSREAIIDHLWGKDKFLDTEHGINTAVRKIRVALRDDSERPRFVQTVTGKGYRFVADVKLDADANASRFIETARNGGYGLPAPEDSPIAPPESLIPTPAQSIASSRLTLTWLGRSLGYLALLGVAASLVLYFFQRRPVVDSIAIVPLANLTGNPEMDYLGDGITDALINNIAQVPSLKVISGRSMLRYKGRDTDLQTLGRELQVQAVLTGKYALSDNKLLISVELSGVRDNRHIWGEQYNRSLDEMAAVREEISRQVTDMLRLKLTPEQRQRIFRSQAVSPDAYQLYLKGRHYQLKDTPEDLKKSRDYYEQAIDAEPGYALAYQGLAQYYGYMGWAGEIPPSEAGAKQEAAVTRALELDPSLGLAHCEMGAVKLFYKWDWENSKNETQRCITLSPNEAQPHFFYALYLRTMRRVDDAVREAQRAEDIDPLTPERKELLGSIYYFARRYDSAAEPYRQLTQSDPDLPGPHMRLFDIYSRTGKESDAISELQKGLTLQGASDLAAAVSAKYKSFGFQAAREFAVREQIKLLLEASKHEYIAPTALAANYSLLDEKDEAFAWLEKASQEHTPDLLDLTLDPDYDNLRSDQRFQDLVRRIGLP
jgi:TolB-like protein/DNA-binding winged helix-turn-helix (wHTH) protein